MSQIIILCEKFFQTKNLYEVFKVKRNATDTAIKEKYNRLVLEIHPDKVKKEMVKIATEKFQLLQTIFNILMDKNQRQTYDECGTVSNNIKISEMEPIYISDNQLEACMNQYASKFRFFIAMNFSRVDCQTIDSEEERQEIRCAYVESEGNIAYVIKVVPFLKPKDEDRIKIIIQGDYIIFF